MLHSEVAQRHGITSKSLGDWIKRYGDQGSQHQTISARQEELRRLKAELQRATEERDILKEAAAYFASESKRGTRSSKSRLGEYSVAKMCRVLEVQRSGFYALLKQPKSRRERKDERLLSKIKQFWIESGFAYGYRNAVSSLGACPTPARPH